MCILSSNNCGISSGEKHIETNSEETIDEFAGIEKTITKVVIFNLLLLLIDFG